MILNLENEVGQYAFQVPPGENLVSVFPDPDFVIMANWEVKGDLKIIENMAIDKKSPWYFAVNGMVKNPNYSSDIALKMADAQVLHRIAYARFLGLKMSDKKNLSEEEILFLKYERNLDVIKAFLEQTFVIQAELTSKVEDWLDLPSYEIKEKALMRLCINDRENAAHYLAATDGIQGTFGHNVRVNWLFLNIALNNGDNEDELVNFASPAFDFFTRIAAFSSLEQLKNLGHLFETFNRGVPYGR